MRQFKLTALSIITIMILVATTFTACKKDAFSEKDALAAQSTLLQTKFSYDLAIKAMDLQIQRSGDSARIVIQTLTNSGATALEILKQTNMLAQILANQNNLLAQLRYADSLSRNTAVISDQLERLRALWNDSITLAKTNAGVALALKKNYSLSFVDFSTAQPLAGVSVSVLQTGSGTFTTAVTNAQGTATFAGLTVDPGTYFTASAANYGTVMVREANLTNLAVVTGQTTTRYNATATSMYNVGGTRNTINGSVLGDLNMTNGDAIESISGQLVTFTSTITVNAVPNIYQFAAMSDASGSFSIGLPDATYTVGYPTTQRVQQKMFVNAWADEDASTSIPRIDETGATIATSGGALAAGPAYGYYFKYPNDVNGKVVVAPFASSGNNSTNIAFNPYNYNTTPTTSFPFANRGVAGSRTDSLQGNNGSALWGPSTYFNNSPAGLTQTNETARYRTRAGTGAQPLDTLPVTLVSLIPGWITTAPQLVEINNTLGRTGNIGVARQDNSQYIQTVAFNGQPVGPTNHFQGTQNVHWVFNNSFGVKAAAGGVFNQAAMFTPSGRQAWTNLGGSTPTTYPTTNLFTNPAGVTVSNANTYYIAIEYRVTTARDRTPR